MATGTIKKTFSKIDAPLDVTWGANTWTAPSDGIVVIRAQWDASGGSGYWYVQDVTRGSLVGYLSTASVAGLTESTSFPVMSGHEYKTNTAARITSAAAYFYPFK